MPQKMGKNQKNWKKGSPNTRDSSIAPKKRVARHISSFPGKIPSQATRHRTDRAHQINLVLKPSAKQICNNIWLKNRRIMLIGRFLMFFYFWQLLMCRSQKRIHLPCIIEKSPHNHSASDRIGLFSCIKHIRLFPIFLWIVNKNDPIWFLSKW